MKVPTLAEIDKDINCFQPEASIRHVKQLRQKVVSSRKRIEREEALDELVDFLASAMNLQGELLQEKENLLTGAKGLTTILLLTIVGFATLLFYNLLT